MAGIIEVANSAYEERDKAQERLALLMKQVERERALASGQVLMDDDNEMLQEVNDDDFKSSLGDDASNTVSYQATSRVPKKKKRNEENEKLKEELR